MHGNLKLNNLYFTPNIVTIQSRRIFEVMFCKYNVGGNVFE